MGSPGLIRRHCCSGLATVRTDGGRGDACTGALANVPHRCRRRVRQALIGRVKLMTAFQCVPAAGRAVAVGFSLRFTSATALGFRTSTVRKRSERWRR